MARTKEETRIYNKAYYKANRGKFRAWAKAYQKENREKLQAYRKAYRKANYESIRVKASAYHEINKERRRADCKTYQEKNREKIRIRRKAFSLANKKRLNAYSREYYKNNKDADRTKACRKIYDDAHKKERNAFLKNKWATDPKFRTHLQKKFKPGMTWENYGKHSWEIDHIIPKSVFNYTKSEDPDFKRCWSLKNLQPMWGSENISKGVKLEKHFQPMLAFG
ncbi:hypothetical protein LCGC14_1639160 [marine sediment metagenome]|uniref:Uncharacterized protein n=1 Tax=marine sediment metagenome TaxID=412755 RepID=A0A0F9IMP8_9ZZZZ